MKRYPKLLQTDARGQIVIPKEIRRALGITDGTGFWAFVIEKEGILLKKVDAPELEGTETKALKDNAEKIGISKKNIEKSETHYTKKTDGVFETL
jgi:AbrB family looped-hinge helix DNA binding protein